MLESSDKYIKLCKDLILELEPSIPTGHDLYKVFDELRQDFKTINASSPDMVKLRCIHTKLCDLKKKLIPISTNNFQIVEVEKYRDCGDLEQQNANLLQIIDNLKRKLDETYEMFDNEISNLTDNQNNEVESLKEEIEKLKNNLKELGIQLNQSSQLNANQASDIINLNSIIESLKLYKNTLTTDIVEISSITDASETKHFKTIKELQDKLKEANTLIKEIFNRNKGLDARNTKLTDENKNLAGQLANLTEMNNKITTSNAELKTQNKELEDMISKSNELKDKVKNMNLTLLKDKILQSDNALGEKNKLNAEISNLKLNLNNLKLNLNYALETNKLNGNELASLRNQHIECENKYSAIVKELKKCEEEKNELNTKLIELQTACTNLKNNLDNARLSEKNIELETNVQQKGIAIEYLNNSLYNANNELTNIKQKLEKLGLDNQELKKQYEEYKNNSINLDVAHEFQSGNAILKAEIAELQIENDELIKFLNIQVDKNKIHNANNNKLKETTQMNDIIQKNNLVRTRLYNLINDINNNIHIITNANINKNINLDVILQLVSFYKNSNPQEDYLYILIPRGFSLILLFIHYINKLNSYKKGFISGNRSNENIYRYNSVISIFKEILQKILSNNVNININYNVESLINDKDHKQTIYPEIRFIKSISSYLDYSKYKTNIMELKNQNEKIDINTLYSSLEMELAIITEKINKGLKINIPYDITKTLSHEDDINNPHSSINRTQEFSNMESNDDLIDNINGLYLNPESSDDKKNDKYFGGGVLGGCVMLLNNAVAVLMIMCVLLIMYIIYLYYKNYNTQNNKPQNNYNTYDIMY